MEVNSHEDSASECCVGNTFSVKLLGFVNKAIKLLLTELIGQCRNLLACLQTIMASDHDSPTVIGRTRHVTSPVWNRTDWFAGPKIRSVGLSFTDFQMGS